MDAQLPHPRQLTLTLMWLKNRRRVKRETNVKVRNRTITKIRRQARALNIQIKPIQVLGRHCIFDCVDDCTLWAFIGIFIFPNTISSSTIWTLTFNINALQFGDVTCRYTMAEAVTPSSFWENSASANSDLYSNISKRDTPGRNLYCTANLTKRPSAAS